MRRILPYVAAVLIYTIMPGAGELTENVVHLVISGHAAHALNDGDHQPRSSEHGCSGTFHVCSCCHVVAFSPLSDDLECDVPVVRTGYVQPCAERLRSSGYRDGIFRPPTV